MFCYSVSHSFMFLNCFYTPFPIEQGNCAQSDLGKNRGSICNSNSNTVILPVSHQFPSVDPIQGHGRAGAFPSCHRAERLTEGLQGDTNNHSHSHSHIQPIWNNRLT